MNLNGIITIVRPKQWLKNLMLFFPPFLEGTLHYKFTYYTGYLAFFAFCLVSSSSYIINDLLDLPNDAVHPHKKNRPIPSGRISIRTAFIVSSILVFCGFWIAFLVSGHFVLFLAGYFVLTFLYSIKLKHVPIVDIFIISSGFILRLLAGGVAFSVAISNWLFLSVFLLALFLSAGKRLSEQSSLGDVAIHHRPSLAGYPPGLLEGTMFITASSVLVTYSMYVISHRALLYSVPVCTFGLLRYIYRVKSGSSGDPTESLLKDPQLFATGALWLAIVSWSIYG